VGVILILATSALLALISLLLYWQLVVAEGAYLGRRIVTLMYDWFAPRYDKVKQFQPAMDTIMLALPILRHLNRQTSNVKDQALILDVATGTGRLPQTLLAQRSFRGHIVALDLSGRMLARARAKLSAHHDRITWVQHDAQQLPFDNDHFDVVICLESIEFFPRPTDAVREMVRVLKPGGLLLLSNRVGPDTWKLPGRVQPTAQFVAWLEQIGLHDVQAEEWLIDYDLVQAVK
jgi:ubiquinone/menaquinone biosynthesis C-methylase UbiE